MVLLSCLPPLIRRRDTRDPIEGIGPKGVVKVFALLVPCL